MTPEDDMARLIAHFEKDDHHLDHYLDDHNDPDLNEHVHIAKERAYLKHLD